MLQTLLKAGASGSELVQLRVEDVSLAERVVTIHQGKSGKRREVPIGWAKSSEPPPLPLGSASAFTPICSAKTVRFDRKRKASRPKSRSQVRANRWCGALVKGGRRGIKTAHGYSPHSAAPT
jgi:integrase